MKQRTGYQMGADAFVYAAWGFAAICGFLGGICGVAALAVWARWSE